MSIAPTKPDLPNPWRFDQAPNVAANVSTDITSANKPILLVTHYEDDHRWGFQSGFSVFMADAQVVAMKEVFLIAQTILEIVDWDQAGQPHAIK